MKKSMLNLGCGRRFHPEWVNIDFASVDSKILEANLCKGIPFPDDSFSFVYHSHLLEHFSKADAPKFLNECFRVLQTGGVIRVAVPDLEIMAHEYLDALENARNGEVFGQQNHEWILLEMYDQISRNHSGGEMAKYLIEQPCINEEFIFARCGVEAKKIMELGKKDKAYHQKQLGNKNLTILKIVRTLLRPHFLREFILRTLLGSEYEALQVGRFRLSGENHQWMYDSYSLNRLLEETGFTKIVVRSAVDSYVTNWRSYNLDTEPDGSIYKPDSIYMEAIKP